MTETTPTRALLSLFIGLFLFASTVASAVPSQEDGPSTWSEDKQEGSLYLAPSRIGDAGFGIYTTKNIPQGERIGEADLVIPILDKFKTLPYRGQQEFLSWLGYVWPSNIDEFYPSYSRDSFPEIPEAMYQVDAGLNGADEGVKFYDSQSRRRVSAVAPGIASLANSSPRLVNIQQERRNDKQERRNDKAYKRLIETFKRLTMKRTVSKKTQQVSFVATRDILAGEELFLYYGEEWHERYQNKLSSRTEYATLEDYQDRVSKTELPTEQDKRRTFEQEKGRLEIDAVDDDEDFIFVDDRSVGAGHLEDSELHEENGDDMESENDLDDSELHEENGDDMESENDEASCSDNRELGTKEEMELGRNINEDSDGSPDNTDDGSDVRDRVKLLLEERVEWLKEHGSCIDNLRVGQSSLHGMGAFAKNAIRKGELIAPAPLLVLKREDLRIYEANETQAAYRNVLNFDNVTGEELLLNYCYGHVHSELLLFPYSPVVNYINHDGREPNAEIEWPSGQSNDWLQMHPLDVLDLSGKLTMGIKALRDIEPGEEVVVNYGQAWQDAWHEFEKNSGGKEFRHEIGVPDGFFPDAWKNQSVVYELAPLDSPLQPGELSLMKFKHNGKPICKYCYRAGLPTGFSQHIRKFSDERGITSLYEKLLSNEILESDEYGIFETMDEQWFAVRYMSKSWNFNMHYIAAWDEAARVSLLRALESGGFEVVLEGIGKAHGLDNMTCFHASFMGISEADNSLTHADVYATGEKGFNIVWPMIVVNGSSPELDIVSDDTNIAISVNYEYDVAFVLGDWGYHKTSPNSYEENGQMRVVLGAYCAQIDDSNAKLIHHLYDGEEPAPFCDQFEKPEIHWENENCSLSK